MSSSKLNFTSVFTYTAPIFISFFIFLHYHSQPSNPTQDFSNDKNYEHVGDIPLVGGAIGPESFVFDTLGGGPYTGVSDGRIIKWEANQRRWIDFAITSPHRNGCEGVHDHAETEDKCGRPLGLRFNESNGDLYIADAYHGVLRVGPEGGLATKVVTHAQGLPLAFTNSLDIDQSTGALYFTDSTSRFQRRHHIVLILSGDETGRLMEYNPRTKQVTVLINNLSFANGVELSTDGNSLLIAETTRCRVVKYWIKTSKAGQVEVFAHLPGFPDNIKKCPRGGYWVAVHSKKGKLIEWVLSHPWIGKFLARLPFDKMKLQYVLAKFKGSGMAVRLGENGEALDVFDEDKMGRRLKSLSEVTEIDGQLLVGSVSLPFVAKYKI